MSSLSELQTYENLKGDLSHNLTKEHCEKLAMCFNLTPAENDSIQKDEEPGKLLVKILDEREVIMPDKMIRMYEGLKAIRLNKVARLVLEYIDTPQAKKEREIEIVQDHKTKVCISSNLLSI